MSEKKPRNLKGKSNKSKEEKYFAPCTNRTHLKSYEDVRRLLSSTINDLRQYKIHPETARAMIFGCQTLLRTFEGIIIEKDIAELLEFARLQQQSGRRGSSCLKV